MEQELNQKIQKIHTEKQSLAERVAALQRTLAGIENEKKEVERSAVRLEKDKSALKKTLDKVGGDPTDSVEHFAHKENPS